MEAQDPSLLFICPVCWAQPTGRCDMNNGDLRSESHLERLDHLSTNEEESPMQQPPQPQIDYAVLEQISEFSKKTQTLPLDVINHALRLWLDGEGAAKLSALGLPPMTPRFDGTGGYGDRRYQPALA